MPTHPGLRASRAFGQALIRRIHGDVLPRARACLARSDARLDGSLTRDLESTQRLLDPEVPSPMDWWR